MVEFQPFRGQYIFGKRLERAPENFIRSDVIDGYQIHSDPALPVCQTKKHSWDAVLVGHVFNHLHPEWGNNEILNDLLKNSLPEILSGSSCLGGRWSLILIGKDHQFAFGDACGTLPITYLCQNEGVILASSSRLIGNCVRDLNPSAIVTKRFLSIEAYSGQEFPLDYTEFDCVKVLLPNRYLNLNSGETTRYPPTTRYPELSAHDVAPKAADIMARLMRAISLRSSLAVPVTSGFDSRAIVGAVSQTPGLAENTMFFTFQDRFDTKPGHFDITNGRKIAEMVGGTHREIKVPEIDVSLRQQIRSYEFMHATRFEDWAAACLAPEFNGHIVVQGWCSEIARCYIRWPGSDNVTADQLASCVRRFEEFEVTKGSFEQWHREATEVRANTGLNILDLFYWEQRCGRWCSSGLNIMSTSIPWISIYSCRDLLDTLLSAKEAERGGDSQTLYREIIRCFNPKLLDVPFNPHPLNYFWFKKGLHRRVRQIGLSVLGPLGLYEKAQTINRKLRRALRKKG